MAEFKILWISSNALCLSQTWSAVVYARVNQGLIYMGRNNRLTNTKSVLKIRHIILHIYLHIYLVCIGNLFIFNQYNEIIHQFCREMSDFFLKKTTMIPEAR